MRLVFGAMTSFILGFFGGALIVQNSAALVPIEFVSVAAVVAALVHWRMRSHGLHLLVALSCGLAIGVAYTTIRAHERMADRLSPALDGETVTLRGTVTGLPEEVKGGVRFLFVPAPMPDAAALPARLALSWYADRKRDTRPVALVPGDRLSLSVRLRRPTSLFNPGGFDHAGWYFARNIGGRGYVREGRLLEHPRAPSIDGTRYALRSWIRAHADPPMAGALIAIAIGDQSAISDAQWDTFRATGTAHLMAISGLHVSIVALLAAGIVSALWRRVPRLALRLPSQRAAVLGSMVVVLAYGALAGFGIPVMRAVLMLAVAAVALWRARRPPVARVLLLALLGVLLVDPWAVVSAGFWLSFGAVGALVLVLGGRVGRPSRPMQFVRAQWAIGLLSAPMLLAVFGQLSLIAPVANLVAIPVVSLVVVPSILVALVFKLTWLLDVAGGVLSVLMHVLDALASSPLATWSAAVPPLTLLCLAWFGALVCLLPRGAPIRVFGLLLWLPAMTWSPPTPALGDFDARVVDVGQGLAVLVRTAHHTLLYDTGRAYYRGGDAGRSIVVPVLRHQGIARLDKLVVSHNDSDHAGGAASILAAIPADEVSTGVGVIFPGVPTSTCRGGETWRWDAVRFEWLHPLDSVVDAKDNNRSCVLRVSGEYGSLLLTGDIERAVEARLSAAGRLLPTDVVVAPHHGSKSSSSKAFVDAVSAQHVIFTAGFNNGYGHPAREVEARWAASGAHVWNTAHDGSIDVRFDSHGAHIASWASAHRRYWHRTSP